MNESIFSTYSTRENRVTASIMAVLRCLAVPRIERLLGALTGDAEFEMVRFQNQPSKGGDGVPDGEIGSSFRLLIETKRDRNALTPTQKHRDQLERHLKRLEMSNEATRLLLVLTPDDQEPALIDQIGGERLVWSNFQAFDQAIEELLSGDRNDKDVISEREEFLLRELQKMFLADGLVGSDHGVLVIPAKRAWPLYNRVHAYVCQEGRPFQPVKHLAFYADNQIYDRVPLIEEKHDEVVFQRGRYKGKLGEVVEKTLDAYDKGEWPYKLSRQKVFLLSAPDAEETLKLKGGPIINDTVSKKTGRPIAFTQNQRYVTLDAIQKAKKTSELVDG
jgi:hypothetical protein